MATQLLVDGFLGTVFIIPLCIGFCLIAMLSRSLPFWLPCCGTFAAYVAYWVSEDLGFSAAVALVAGLLAAGATVTLVYFAVMRRFVAANLPYSAILHGIAITLIVQATLALATKGYAASPTVLSKPLGAFLFRVGPSQISAMDIAVVCASLGLVAWVSWFLGHTRKGLVLKAIAGNRELAFQNGLPVGSMERQLLGIAALLTSASAIAYAVKFDLKPQMLSDPTVKVLGAVVAVGPSRPIWACFAVVAIGMLDSLSLASQGLAPFSGTVGYCVVVGAVLGRLAWDRMRNL